MCGLTGFLETTGRTEDQLCQQVTCMANTLIHRGPDDLGTWVDASAGVALGFRRLAIIDLSPMGHQPMFSADDRYVIIFNGEVYNYRELRAELIGCGYPFRGQSDTEVILAGCVHWGIEPTLRRLVGMFAIALWDRQGQILTLARDRVGKKPLYYAETPDALVFGSELKALRKHPCFTAQVDRNALTLYMRYGYVPAPYSIYQDTFKLPPGHYATIRAGQPAQVTTYWDARQVVLGAVENRLDLTDQDAIDQFDALLRDAVARRMIADVPLGAFLSGGIDSSTVVALMQAQSTRPVKTFSIGFCEDAYNEAESAKAVARHLGTDHTELYVTPEEAQAVIPRLPDLYDEPFADSSQIPTFLVSQLARKHVTVSLSGDGGDELFAGYKRYRWANDLWKWLQVGMPFRGVVTGAIHSLTPAQWDAVNHPMSQALPSRFRIGALGHRLYNLADLMQADNQQQLYRDLMSLCKSPTEWVNDGKEPTTVFSSPNGLKTVSDYTERMMYWDLVTYLPDDILAKVDRASMGVSLEARCPLLDHRIAEWVWRLPLSFKQRDGQTKWLLRQVLDRYVPSQLVDRPKSGFAVPIGAWLRGPLRDWAENLLDEKRLQQDGYLNPRPIRRAWADQLAGNRNDHARLWAVLMFQAWRNKLLDD